MNPILAPGEPRRITLDGRPSWLYLDGTILPIFAGAAGESDADDTADDAEDEASDDDDDSNDDEGDEDGDDEDDGQDRPSEKSVNRAHRDAARYRTQRNEARSDLADMTARAEHAEAERDAARGELAFERAARDTFVDTAAAWKLADRKLIRLADDGTVEGMDEAVADLIERQPLLVRADDEPGKKSEPNPFAGRSGRPAGKKARPGPGYDKAVLAKKYPALRDR